MLASDPPAAFLWPSRRFGRKNAGYRRLAHRNALFALWAGRLLQPSEPSLAAYAASMRFTDLANSRTILLNRAMRASIGSAPRPRTR